MAQEERYHIHLFSKTRRLEDNDEPTYKFSELPKLLPVDDSNYCAHLYTEKVSVGLVETQTIVILGEDEEGNIKPLSQLIDQYSEAISDGWKIFLFIDTMEQENLRFFTVNQETNTIEWTDRLLLDPTSDILTAQIGFVGDKEGQYENNLYICEIRTLETDPSKLTGVEDLFHVGTVKVYSSAIGEDERYRRFFENFGVPDPISYMDVFMDNEDHGDGPNYGKYDDKMDYNLLNQRSKQLFLSYHEIFPYVGTYKALINAVDILGYNDIYFKEWYRELTEDATKVQYTTYEIPYKNTNTKNVITSLPLEQRVLLKKLNWLTMVYKISEEALDADGVQMFEELEDNVRVPIIKQNYKNYEANEILVKLIALKKWLEKNIIGINCRIIDINGEGLVVERYKFRTFAKTTEGMDYYDEHYLTPYIIEEDSSFLLDNSKAKIALGLKEQYQDDNEKYFYAEDEEGNKTPVYDHFVVRASLSSKNSALSARKAEGRNVGIVTKTLLIQDGEILFDPKVLATSTEKIGLVSEFNILPLIQIERARLRNPNMPWKLSTEYEITNERYDDASTGEKYNYKVVNVKTREITRKVDSISLRPTEGASLKYTAENKLNVPLFIMENFKDYIIPDAIEQDKPYILELLDGKFIFNEEVNGVNRTTYLNFHFDTDDNEQNIEVNYVYNLTVPFNDDLITKDPSTGKVPHLCDITVGNTGTYSVYVYGMDNFGLIHGKRTDTDPTVYIQNPEIEVFTTYKNSNNESDFFNINVDGDVASYNYVSNSGTLEAIPATNISLKETFLEDPACVMREQYLMTDVSVNTTKNGDVVVRYATYPTISYSIDTPKENDYAHFMNIVDNFDVVSFISSDALTDGYFVTPNTQNTYNYNAETKYALVWLKRNNVFKSNTLNDGIHKDDVGNVVSFAPARLTNIVVYDNLHSEAFYEDMCYMNYGYNEDENEYMEYIILQEDAMEEITLYYKNNFEIHGGHICIDPNVEKKYPYSHNKYNHPVSTVTETVAQFGTWNEDSSEEEPCSMYGNDGKVYIDRSVGLDSGSIHLENIFKEGKLFRIYAQPAYEIPVSEIITFDNENTIIKLKDGYYPNLANLFPVGKKVKLIHKMSLDESNELISQNLFTCVGTTGNAVILDSRFPYTYDEKKTMYMYDFLETHTSSDVSVDTNIDVNNVLVRRNFETIRIGAKDAHYQSVDACVIDGNDLSDINFIPSEDQLRRHYVYISDSNSLVPRIYLAYAHNAFVDYVMTVDHARELINGYTELFVKDDTLLKYVDDTFCISNRDFDIKNAFDIWMDKDEDTKDAEICKYAGNGYESFIINTEYGETGNESSATYRYKTYIVRPLNPDVSVNIENSDDTSVGVIWWDFELEADIEELPKHIYYNTGVAPDASVGVEYGPMQDMWSVQMYKMNKNKPMEEFKSCNILQDITLYRYKIPVSLSTLTGNTNIILSPVTNGTLPITAFSTENLEAHCRWRLYKYNTLEDKNEILFESWNTAMFLTPTEPGIYSAELTIFDDYGNMTTVLSEGIFKVKD